MTPEQIAAQILREAADWEDPGPSKSWTEFTRNDPVASIVACANRGTAARLRWLANQYADGNRRVEIRDEQLAAQVG